MIILTISLKITFLSLQSFATAEIELVDLSKYSNHSDKSMLLLNFQFDTLESLTVAVKNFEIEKLIKITHPSTIF